MYDDDDNIFNVIFKDFGNLQPWRHIHIYIQNWVFLYEYIKDKNTIIYIHSPALVLPFFYKKIYI